MLEKICLPHFANAAAAAAVFELRVRMLADNTGAVRTHAFSDLTPLLKALVKHFADKLSEDEAAFLLSCAGLRNKLLHLELSRAKGRLVSLGEQLVKSGVLQVDLESGDASEVAVTSTQEGRIYGWLWESATSGAFHALCGVFVRAMAILKRLRDGDPGASANAPRQRPVDGLAPFADLVMGDPRNRRIDPDGLREDLMGIRLSPAAPEVVRHEIRTAKQVFMAGWFFYELFADVFHHCAVASEAALRERFVADLPLPAELVPPKQAAKKGAAVFTVQELPTADMLMHHLRQFWRLKSHPNVDGSFKGWIKWLRETKRADEDTLIRLDAAREWRNRSAHGSVAILEPPIGILEECVWIINGLFPDKETDEYDRPRKEEKRRAQAEQFEEMKKLREEIDRDDP